MFKIAKREQNIAFTPDPITAVAKKLESFDNHSIPDEKCSCLFTLEETVKLCERSLTRVSK